MKYNFLNPDLIEISHFIRTMVTILKYIIEEEKYLATKGQLISKGLFWVFNSSKNGARKGKNSTYVTSGRIVSFVF